MQLQLSLKVADRLHETLLVRGEPLDAAEAVRMLVASADLSGPLCLEILQVLVQEDRRFCWDGGDRELLSLRNWEVPDPELATVPFVALDLETTGARAGTDKTTEIGAVRIEGFRAVKHFSTLVNPLRPIPPMISRITGITQSMVADAPRIEEVIPDLLEFLEGAVVVAHNAPFDVGFLNYELQRLKGRRLGEGAIDTLPLARALAPGLANYRLHTVAAALGAPVAACHRALADAQAAGHVFVELAGRLRERGITRLGEVRAYGSPSARSHLDKLSLTRDLPRSSGTYRFWDKDGQILYVGKADRLGERVRSQFVAGPSRDRRVRTAVRLVERIDWQETSTPLEAVVQEQRLILEHRPSCNLHGTRPESYAYIKAGGDGPGLSLFASNHPPHWLADLGENPSSDHRSLIIGPFRKRSGVSAALHLLKHCYPIKRCPRQRDGRPCARGELGQCLAPCTGDRRNRRQHDALVTSIVEWLAGRSQQDSLDPLRRADEAAWALLQQERYDEAQSVRQASDHLLSVRRSYASLAEARGLCFAALWPQANNGDAPSLRLNLVWNGLLREPVSLRPDSVDQQIDAALEPLRILSSAASAKVPPPLVAVPQCELDSILAVRRWFHETEHAPRVLIPSQRANSTAWLKAKKQLAAEACSLLSVRPPFPGKGRKAV
jgi:DNA polymerase-3 subunit epsilon